MFITYDVLSLYHVFMNDTSTYGGIADFFADLLFPRYCISCFQDINDAAHCYLCEACSRALPLMSITACAFCAAPVVDGRTCSFCRKTYALDRLFVAASYVHPCVERLTKTLKYRFARIAAHDVARLMLRYVAEKKIGKVFLPVSAIVPVPLHPRRLRWRGFNQSELIARDIADALAIPLVTNAIVRVRHSTPQADIKDRHSRIENARGLFALADLAVKPLNAVSPLQGKTVLLIDDLSTTGSTLDECARVLKDAGAFEVMAFVFARN